MKILSIGSSQANFLVELYGQISKFKPELAFTLSGSKIFDEKIEYTNKNSINYIDINQITSKKHTVGFLLLNLIRNRKYFKNTIPFIEEVAFLVFKSNLNIKYTLKRLIDLLNERYIGNMVLSPLFEKYDVVHVHFLMLHNIKWAWYIPEQTKVICSFWGSDLLRTSGVENSFYISHLLNRANIITSQSLEMREIILAKYGRSLYSKCRMALFALPDKLFNEIDHCLKKEGSDIIKSTFLEKLGLDKNKPTIVIANNGSSYNNHLEIFHSLLHTTELQFDSFNYIFPCTYLPQGKEHLVRLENATANYSNCIILKEYLSWQDLAALRVSADYFIHAPKSDAMSGALTESIYAGSIPIVGSWLPYQNYDRIGIQLIRVDDFDEIPIALKKAYTVNISEAQSTINTFLRGATITQTWINIYKSIK